MIEISLKFVPKGPIYNNPVLHHKLTCHMSLDASQVTGPSTLFVLRLLKAYNKQYSKALYTWPCMKGNHWQWIPHKGM